MNSRPLPPEAHAHAAAGRRLDMLARDLARRRGHGTRRFVWYDWLMIAELDGDTDDVMRLYTWGLDLAGQAGTINSLEEAGGIGGLLATRNLAESPNRSYVHFYDGNGNTGQLVKRSDGSLAAKYEYDAYGNLIGPASPGPFASTNAWRFSTKYFDDETGLGYWGRRYYRPAEGRWINRDPIEEEGGQNLYAYVENEPVQSADPTGLAPRYLCCPYAYVACRVATGNPVGCFVCSLLCWLPGDRPCHRCDGVRGPHGTFRMCDTPACRLNLFPCGGC